MKKCFITSGPGISVQIFRVHFANHHTSDFLVAADFPSEP